MKLIKSKNFEVELTSEELELIRGLTQNPPQHSSEEEKELYLSLFVSSSRILGFDMNDDGTIVSGSLRCKDEQT